MKLIFVYNAQSGITSSVINMAHKLLQPKTYNCKLCILTHHTFNENKQWKSFRENSTTELEFYHIDDFESVYNFRSNAYPVILKSQNNKLEVALMPQFLNKLLTTEDLIEAVKIIK